MAGTLAPGAEVAMPPTIVNNRIAGTRITVYDVYYYLDKGCPPEEIADVLSLSPEDVAAALAYVAANRDAVRAVHEQIEERHARGNPPEVEAKREASRAKLQAWLKQRGRGTDQESNGAGDPGGR
jgi:uncharacterized protein (DUF433 family)